MARNTTSRKSNRMAICVELADVSARCRESLRFAGHDVITSAHFFDKLSFWLIRRKIGSIRRYFEKDSGPIEVLPQKRS